jgi:hypothetical protein
MLTELTERAELRTNAHRRQAYARKCYEEAANTITKLPAKVAVVAAASAWLDCGSGGVISALYGLFKAGAKQLRGRYYENAKPELQAIDEFISFVNILAVIRQGVYFSHLAEAFLPYPACWEGLFNLDSCQPIDHQIARFEAEVASRKRALGCAFVGLVVSLLLDSIIYHYYVK